MYRSQFEFENELKNGYPYVSDMKENLSYDIPHYHSELEIVYVAHGSLTAICDGERFTVNQNEFFIFMPGVVHSFAASQENSIYYAKIPEIGKNDFFSLRPECCAVKKGSKLHEMLIDATVKLFEENEHMHKGYEFAVMRYANEILEKLCRCGELKPIPGDDRTKVATKLALMRNVNAYIKENYGEKILLSDAARTLGYSKYYFAHLFKEATQISFYSYVTMMRLEKAVELLRAESKSITEIAHECGFGSMRSFNRSFRNYYHASPKEFIKTQT